MSDHHPDRRFRGRVKSVGNGWYVWAVLDLDHKNTPVAWGEEGHLSIALRQAQHAVFAYRGYYMYKRQGTSA